MKKITSIILLFVIFNVQAQTPAEKGLEIAIEADRRDSGWIDQTASMEMILKNRSGDTSERKLRIRSLEVEGDGDKSMIIFDNPKDVKGTALLTYTHSTKPDEQWLFLPSLKRVKRISSSNKSGPFMGSEFAYEDMTSQEVDKYTYTYLRNETIEGRDTFVIERKPVYKKSGYTRHIAWVDTEMYQPLKLDFYDRKNSLLKTLTFKGYQQYLSKYWRADELNMVNHQNGKSTDMIWHDYTFKNGFSARNFDKNSLKRMR